MTRHGRTILMLSVAVVATILLEAAAYAIPRTFVFSTGNDANTCERTAPCRTFAGALAKTDTKGEIVVLDSGQYGLVNITKAVRITAVGVVAAIEASFGSTAVTVSVAPADVVVLRGITLSGKETANIGISYTGGGTLRVEECTVTGFKEEGISFTGAGQLFVQDTVIRNNKSYGVHIAPGAGTATALIDHCQMVSNLGGLRVDGPAGTSAKATVRDSVAVEAPNQANYSVPAGFGYSANGPMAQINVVDSEALNNDVGFKAEDGAKVEARNCVSSNNGTGFYAVSGGLIHAKECTATKNNHGMFASGAASRVVAKGCQLVSNSGSGLLVSSGGTALISDSMVTGNKTGLENLTGNPGTLKTFGNNRIHKNTTDKVGTITPVSQM